MNEPIKHIKYKWLPSEPTKNMVLAATVRDRLRYDTIEENLLDAYERMWQAAPEVEQEPATYMSFCDGAGAVPLYTHPQNKRERLSIHQLLKMHADNKFDWFATARAVEKYYTE